jgi:fructose-1,6-bisphosphatase
LISRKEKRRFCRRVNKEERNTYIELSKINAKSELTILQPLDETEGIKKVASYGTVFQITDAADSVFHFP